MTLRMALLITVATFAGNAAMAAITSDELVAQYQAQNYTSIDVKRGPTQIKVEAYNGTQKVEAIYDTATGAVLKSETGLAEANDDDIRPGVRVRDRDQDFLDGASDDDSSDDSDEDDDSDDSDEDDDDISGSGHSGGDDDGDDDGSDDSDDDHGGDDDGGDDGDDDHGGQGRGGDDGDDD